MYWNIAVEQRMYGNGTKLSRRYSGNIKKSGTKNIYLLITCGGILHLLFVEIN